MLNITVCILSYNRAAYLRDALQSVFTQTSMPAEIIIFDNGSKIDVKEAVKDFLQKGVHWIGSDITHNSYWNFRRTIAEVKTKYVLVLHDDDRLTTTFIEKQISFLEKNSDIGAVTCNGYLINEAGIKTGRVLRPEFIDGDAEIYNCSVDVAIRYASDSCIPLSPTVYKTELVRSVEFRDDFDKVRDATFFCDMADVAKIAYQPDILYECRIHAGQDSFYFPIDLQVKLETFLRTRKSNNINDIVHLNRLLDYQHTSRILRRIYCALKKPYLFGVLFDELRNIWVGEFSTLLAIKIVISAVKKRCQLSENYKR